MTAAEQILLRRDEDGVSILTLNRPQARNALSTALMAALHEELATIASDPSIGVVVIEANGPAFCAGHDLREVREMDKNKHLDLFQQCSALMSSIVHLPKPVIAKVHAMATAAGCQLAASCDLVYAAEEARFATPGVNIGLFCSTPMVALSRAVGRKKAMEMLLSGRPISAAEAEIAGLVNAAVPAAELDATVIEMARLIASKSPLTLAIGKEAFYRQVEMPLDEAYDYASRVMAHNMAARDAEEGITAFIEKREPVWTGK